MSSHHISFSVPPNAVQVNKKLSLTVNIISLPASLPVTSSEIEDLFGPRTRTRSDTNNTVWTSFHRTTYHVKTQLLPKKKLIHRHLTSCPNDVYISAWNSLTTRTIWVRSFWRPCISIFQRVAFPLYYLKQVFLPSHIDVILFLKSKIRVQQAEKCNHQ